MAKLDKLLEDGDTDGSLQSFIIFFWLGIGNLLPWNAFITAAYYFHQRFCNTSYKDDFESIFSFCATISQSIILFFVVKYGSSFSYRLQVILPLILIAFCFALTTIFVVTSNISGNQLFTLTVI